MKSRAERSGRLIAFGLCAMAACACSSDPARTLKAQTGIDLTKDGASISFVSPQAEEKAGYNIDLQPGHEGEFYGEMRSLAGAGCIQYLKIGNGCHFATKAGRDVFVSKAGADKFLAFTA